MEQSKQRGRGGVWHRGAVGVGPAAPCARLTEACKGNYPSGQKSFSANKFVHQVWVGRVSSASWQHPCVMAAVRSAHPPSPREVMHQSRASRKLQLHTDTEGFCSGSGAALWTFATDVKICHSEEGRPASGDNVFTSGTLNSLWLPNLLLIVTLATKVNLLFWEFITKKRNHTYRSIYSLCHVAWHWAQVNPACTDHLCNVSAAKLKSTCSEFGWLDIFFGSAHTPTWYNSWQCTSEHKLSKKPKEWAGDQKWQSANLRKGTKRFPSALKFHRMQWPWMGQHYWHAVEEGGTAQDNLRTESQMKKLILKI